MAGLRRAHQDVMKLMLSKYEIELDEAHGKTTVDFLVKNFKGPPGTPYEGGVFILGVHLPADYPFKSPSIGFRTRVFHPNIDERSGSVCLDVINQSWSPMYDLINIFDVFLPQLLTYGNAADPLNGDAAALMLREPEKFKSRVLEYIRVYATPKATGTPASVSTTATSSPLDLAAGKPGPAPGAAAAAAASSSGSAAAAGASAPGMDEDAASVASDVSEMSDL